MPEERPTGSAAPTQQRVVVRGLEPVLDGGRHPIKRVTGDTVAVTADVYGDGHDRVTAVLQHRRVGAKAWRDEPFLHLGNDHWAGTFTVGQPGDWEYRVLAWVDHLTTWREHLVKKVDAGVDVPMHLLAGADLLRDLAGKRRSKAAAALRDLADQLGDEDVPQGRRIELAYSDEFVAACDAGDPRRHATATDPLRVHVDRERGAFSSWYELFPRSLGAPDEHGTLQDVIEELPRIAELGFDVVYLPPIHPIGVTARKGRNNTLTPDADDVGVPWAIGGEAGGHDAVHPELGTVADVAELARVARDGHGIDIALDLAFQCSPDHPWVTEHPEWFRSRPDGSIQYAENPPKKYEDIYPLDFETSDPEGLWTALRDVTLFWVEQGIRVFRVDNPHTKSFPFWEWCIAEVRREHPDVLFLAEAFTRPRVMEELAKSGFAQSYSYFTWREHKWELEEYVRDSFHTERIDYMRPNFWPNTPDILPEHLQTGGRPVFVHRLLLAAMLDANYGIYGPPYEVLEGTPRHHGSEEYLDSEKYQLRSWDLPDPATATVHDHDSVTGVIKRVNEIRREHPALQRNRNLTLHHVGNDQLLAWSKCTDDGSDVVLVVVSLDPHHRQGDMLHLDMGGLRLDDDAAFVVEDLLTGQRYHWQGQDNYVELGPELPGHVFHVQPRTTSEERVTR